MKKLHIIGVLTVTKSRLNLGLKRGNSYW